MDDYIIYGAGFPPQYYVLEKGEDGIWKSVFGPDPDLVDAEAKLNDLSGVRARNNKTYFFHFFSIYAFKNEEKFSQILKSKKFSILFEETFEVLEKKTSIDLKFLRFVKSEKILTKNKNIFIDINM